MGLATLWPLDRITQDAIALIAFILILALVQLEPT